MKMKKVCVSILSLLSAASLTFGASTQAYAAKSSSHDLLSQIKQRGYILVGTEGNYAPYDYRDSHGNLVGFDVDIANAIAKQLGVKVKFVETPWAGIFAGLNDKRFDMIVDEVTITSDRQKKYAFSTEYIQSAADLIVQKNNNSIHGFKDLKGKTEASSLTSEYGTMAKQYGAKVVDVQGFNEEMSVLLSGRVDSVINDKMSFLTFMGQHPNAPVKVVASDKRGAQQGVCMRKGNATLVKAVDKALATIEKNGTYNKISKKWFGQNVLH